MLERPFRSGRSIFWNCGAVENIIDIKANLSRFPLDREHVEIVGELFSVRQRKGSTDSSRCIANAVQCTMHRRGLLADVFHDVDLAAGRPADFIDVAPEHPEGRPNALSVRNL